MALTKDHLLERLTSAGVQFTSHEHAAVMTAEAQAEVLSSVPGTVTKNLFLKDKKKRLYVVTAVPSTKIDLKVLSARLGLGKGGISMAPSEAITEVLQVALGSVTPLALANASASSVILLLDQQLKSQEAIYVHPLLNTHSLGLTPAAFDAAIRAVGCEPVYADLEADPKIDKDNPPDLRFVTEGVEVPAAAAAPATPAAAPAAAAAAPAASKAAVAAAPANKQAASGKKDAGKGKAGKPDSSKVHAQITDVSARTDELLQLVASQLLGCKLEEVKVEPYVLRRLQADVESKLNAVKNAAYTSGYLAAKGQIVGAAERRFA